MTWASKAVLSIVMSRLAGLVKTVEELDGKADTYRGEIWGSIVNLNGDDRHFLFSRQSLADQTGLDVKSITNAKRDLDSRGIVKWTRFRRADGGDDKHALEPQETFKIRIRPAGENSCFVDWVGEGKMAGRGGKSGNYPEGKVATTPRGILASTGRKSGNRNDHPRDYHPPCLITNKSYHSRSRRTKPSQPIEFCCRQEGRQTRSKAAGWPNLKPWNLANPNDLLSVHSILASTGLVGDHHDGLRLVVLASVMARRLAHRRPRAYFATILRQGFTTFGPADIDHAAAKLILRELDA